jgi:hypoxanthine phosphoribosyltransferase
MRGTALSLRMLPAAQVAGRTVLLVDDILDEGITLAALHAKLMDLGATRVLTAVFAVKQTGRVKPLIVDFFGLPVPDAYVFGFGMDVRGYWRNLPVIYALEEK